MPKERGQEPSYRQLFARAGMRMWNQAAPFLPPELNKAIDKAAYRGMRIAASRPVVSSETTGEIQKGPEELLQEKLIELRKVRHLLPENIVIIPDGNRREAAKHGMTVEQGHEWGARVLYDSLSVFDEFTEIKNITLWAWSEDNELKRPKEKSDVFGTVASLLEQYTPELAKRGAVITSVGREDRLLIDRENEGEELAAGKKLADQLKKAKEATNENTGPNIIIAIDYGEVYEDTLYGKALLKSGIKEEELTHDMARRIRQDNMGIPDPQLLARTSGEMRLSRFPYGNHAELYFIPVNLPQLQPYMIADALLSYAQREQRGGQ